LFFFRNKLGNVLLASILFEFSVKDTTTVWFRNNETSSTNGKISLGEVKFLSKSMRLQAQNPDISPNLRPELSILAG